MECKHFIRCKRYSLQTTSNYAWVQNYHAFLGVIISQFQQWTGLWTWYVSCNRQIVFMEQKSVQMVKNHEVLMWTSYEAHGKVIMNLNERCSGNCTWSIKMYYNKVSEITRSFNEVHMISDDKVMIHARSGTKHHKNQWTLQMFTSGEHLQILLIILMKLTWYSGEKQMNSWKLIRFSYEVQRFLYDDHMKFSWTSPA